MIQILENSDLLKIDKGIICHQTNCIGVMGGGIALQIRNKWPNVYKQYVNECELFKNNPMYGKNWQDYSTPEKIALHKLHISQAMKGRPGVNSWKNHTSE